MKIKVHVIELINHPDEQFKEYDIEKEIPPEKENRHSDLCKVCHVTQYPECRKYCSSAGYEAEKRGGYVRKRLIKDKDGNYIGVPIDD